MTGNHKKKKCLSAMLMVILAMAWIMTQGGRPSQATETDDAYSVTVNVAADDYIKEDPQLKDVTLNIYKLADSDWQQAGSDASEPEFGEAAVSYVTDHEMAVSAQTTFGTQKRLEEKGLYVVIPVLKDDVEMDAAGNVVVKTDEWIYTFSPMVISVPASTVIYVKTERKPVREAIPEKPKCNQVTIVDSTVTDIGDVKTGDMFDWYPLLIAAAAAVLTALIRHKKTDIR